MARSAVSQRGAWAFTILALLLTIVGLFWPVLVYLVPPTTTASTEVVTITNYKADFKLDKDGTLDVVENITGQFPAGRHGIFRYWDVTDPTDPHVRLWPQDIKVLRDGQPERTDLSWEHGRRYRVAKIGKAETLLDPGTHVYTISYSIDGAIAPASAGAPAGSWSAGDTGSAFYWNLIPGGWDMPIDKSKLTVQLPAKGQDVTCAVGWGASASSSTYPCKVTDSGDQLTVTTQAIPARTPVTVRAAMAMTPPDRVTLPWPIQFDMVFGRSVLIAGILLVLSLIGLVVGKIWQRRSLEAEPGYPVMYAPPEGLGPVQTYYVAAERAPSNALIATLLYAAERGLVKLTQVSSSDWVIEGLAEHDAWQQVDVVTQAVGDSLGVSHPGGVFRADGTVTAGKTLQSVNSSLNANVSMWARTSGLVVSASSESLGRSLVLVAFVFAGVLFFWHPGDITMMGLPFAGFAIGGAGLLSRGVGTRRTQAGREVWSKSEGFYRLLSTPSSEDRFDFSARKDLYTAYIPYAVAFDCAEQWAKKYEYSTGEPAPVPLWYGGAVTGGYMGGGASFASFQSSLNSSIGAYEASQRSSSSSGGGGGFSGGGGGGGGGGGSW